MSLRAGCPSCGAELELRSSASLYAVCPSCASLVMRKDLDVERIGVVAQLQPDSSPIQLGTRGKHKGRAFEVVGRIQLHFEAGFWNEWYLLFDDGKDGWLGEASGQYGVSFRVPDPEASPSFEALGVGQAHDIGGVRFTVRDLQRARCVGGQGELPFRIESGYEAPVVDLATTSAVFATIDYSEDPPLVFVGQWAKLAELSFTHLRAVERTGPAPAVATWGCAQCGAHLEVKSSASLVVACPYCESIVDAQDPSHRVLERYREQTKLQPEIPLGATGTLRGMRLEHLGFVQKRSVVETAAYYWREYLLWSPLHGYRWLTEYDHHWTLLEPTLIMPQRAGAQLRALGRSYRHFQTADAELTYVLGELNWSARRGETVTGHDFVAPPYLYSEEVSDNEVNWSAGEYLEAKEIWAAFALPGEPQSPIGVHAAQPSPYAADARAVRRAGLLFAALLTLAQLGSCAAARNTQVLDERFQIALSDADKSHTTQSFQLSRRGNLEIQLGTDLENQWAYVEAALISPDHEEVIELGRELEYYHGYEDGESWSEGDRWDSVLVGRVPPGTWSLRLEVESPAPQLAMQVKVKSDVPRFAYWVWAMILFCLPWLWFESRRYRFEVARWMESDHPMVKLQSGDDDE